MRRPLLSALLLLTGSCSSGREPVATVNPELASLLSRAQSVPRVRDGVVQVATRSLLAEIHGDGAIALHGERSLALRVSGAASAPRVEDRLAVMGDTTVFDRGTAIEILHRLDRPRALSYTVDLPADLRLQPTLDPTALEVVDAAGVARMRLTADAAWDRAGARVPVRLSVAGARVAIEVPASAAYPVVIDPAWSATTLPARLRTGHTATMMGDGNVLVAGGGNASAEIFDTRTARFSLVGSMSAARTNHSATLLPDGRVWIAGGSGATTELYDPTTRTFSAGPSMTTVSGATKAVRLGDGTVLVAGGSSAERFDPVTNTLTTLTKKTAATTPVALTSGNVLFVGPANAELYRAATSDFVALTPGIPGLAEFGVPTTDGNAVVFGGSAWISPFGESGTTIDSAWAFNASSNTFTKRSDGLPSAPLATVLPSGKAFFVGPDGGGTTTYDPVTNTWASAPTPADHRKGTLTVLPSGTILAIGGPSGGADAFVAADPGGSLVASATSQLAVASRLRGGFTRLYDGRVLAVGGVSEASGETNPSKTAELWTAGTWATTASPAVARVNHAQALLPSGKVLVAGGDGTSTAEVFDPTSKTFASTGSLSVVRSGAAVVALPSGKILVAGGGASTAELYDETKGTFSSVTSTMSAAHSNFGGALLPSGRVLLVDGTTSELFDPATETFSLGPTLGAPRDGRQLTPTPDGGLLALGKSLTLRFERYSPVTNAFSFTAPMTSSFFQHSAGSLPFGRTLFGFGTNNSGEFPTSLVWVFDAVGASALGDATDSFNAPFQRVEARLVPTVAGGLLVVGGTMNAGAVAGSSARDTATLTPPGWSLRPTITKAPTTIVPGAPFDVEGTRFTDVGRAPSFTFVPAAGVGSVFVTTASFTGTTAKVVLPATAFRGKGFLHVSVGGVISAGLLVDIGAAANGAACTEGASCGSGFCVDGVCCDTRCEGVCFACSKARKGSGADGTCGAIPPEKDPKDACASFQGAPCTSDAQCATGICADGVCCDARCDGQCEACSVEGSLGTCVPVVGDPKGTRGKCDAGTDACNAKRCDGKNRKACDGFSPSTTSCRMGSCAAGVETLAASCTGDGACPAAVTKSCEPFACGDGGCLTRCTADSECAPSYRCTAGKCVTGPYCADARTLKTPGAADKDCAPYACEGDKCKITCGSSLECAGGFICTGGECVAAPSGASTDEGGGCSTTAARSGASWLGLLLLAGLVRRRSATP